MPDAGAGARDRRSLTPAAALALCAIAVWVVWGPVRETLAVAGSEATSASYYAPVERFLAGVAGAAGLAGARGGAADALALGGGAAGAERVAGARLGQADGNALRRRAARRAG